MERGDSIEFSDAFERLKLIRSSNKSAVWKHFGFLEPKGNLVKCIHCETTLKYSNNTTNFRTHLRSRHRGIFDLMIASGCNTAGTSNSRPDNIESPVGTIVYEILPSDLAYCENASVPEKGSAGSETSILIEGINSTRTVPQECVSVASSSYEKTEADESEIGGREREVSLLKEVRINRKRKTTSDDLATIVKLMREYLEYQKESDKLFLEMERQWQEREERLRKEDREHSLYMLKLLLAKKQDK